MLLYRQALISCRFPHMRESRATQAEMLKEYISRARGMGLWSTCDRKKWLVTNLRTPSPIWFPLGECQKSFPAPVILYLSHQQVKVSSSMNAIRRHLAGFYEKPLTWVINLQGNAKVPKETHFWITWHGSCAHGKHFQPVSGPWWEGPVSLVASSSNSGSGHHFRDCWKRGKQTA